MRPSLRLAGEADAPAFLEIYAPLVRETPISFELEPPGLDEYRGRIRATLEQKPWLACEENGSILGFAYAGKFRPRPAYQWTAETTVHVHPSHHRRSVGRALYAGLLEILKLQGYRSALAVITVPNPASVALHEKLGFEPVGVIRAAGYKLGRWHDVGFWQLELQEPPDSPQPPRGLAEVREKPAWRDALLRAEEILAR